MVVTTKMHKLFMTSSLAVRHYALFENCQNTHWRSFFRHALPIFLDAHPVRRLAFGSVGDGRVPLAHIAVKSPSPWRKNFSLPVIPPIIKQTPVR